MAKRPAPTAVTYRIPMSLDDRAVKDLGTGLRAVAADPRVDRLRLDCGELQAVSARGLGLLAAVRMIVSRRGAQLEAFGSTIEMAAQLRLVGISTADEQDWSPWLTSASANA
ncbi:MAG: hypothetical protein QOI82_610 [Actinomycetota bacterium]|jgi:anti-anti-sigma regulatory factor|nr:hypothetical protein [Actinomycetota bacterium]